ncbi:MAG TPA: lipoate--protein ligase family protein [Chloroflexia bacterium]|nr:lipoate--protein ligase family protein [Chloroflexia bacterium]
MIAVSKDNPIPSTAGVWRLFRDFGLPGPENMALDEALLDSVIDGGQTAVRFYTWQPFTLSLGVNQASGEINPEECLRRGFGIVRRITGGRAVLHQHELTYSVIAPEQDPRVSGGVIESYRKISEALVRGLRSLGADVALSEPNRALVRAMADARRYRDLGELEESSHGAVCFDTASAYEISVGGRKLVGSAQARRGGVILQHGSILLDVDWDAWASVFAYASDRGRERALEKLPQRMTSLRQVLGRSVQPEEVAAALQSSFGEVFGTMEPGAVLSPGEKDTAALLTAGKYSSNAWTFRT